MQHFIVQIFHWFHAELCCADISLVSCRTSLCWHLFHWFHAAELSQNKGNSPFRALKVQQGWRTDWHTHCISILVINNGRKKGPMDWQYEQCEERGIERGSTLRSSLKGQERGHHLSDKHWNCFKGNVGETSEQPCEAHADFSKHLDIILNWAKPCGLTQRVRLFLFTFQRRQQLVLGPGHFWHDDSGVVHCMLVRLLGAEVAQAALVLQEREHKIQDYFIISSEKFKRGRILTTSQGHCNH